MDSEVPLLIFLLFLSGLFSSAEVAFISLSEAKVRSFVDKKHRGALSLSKLKSNPQRLLITILIGNNLVNIAASVMATNFALRVFDDVSLGIVTGVLTFFILMFGEIVPKSIAVAHSEYIAKALSHPFLFLQWILLPVIFFFEQIIRLFFIKKQKGTSVSEEEILALVSLGKEEGTIEAHEKEFIANVLEFSDTQVQEIMTPRTEMLVLDENTTIEKAIYFFVDHHHSRIPIYRKTIDNITGILTIKDALTYSSKKRKNIKIKNLPLVPAIIIPHTKAIKALFNELKRRKIHMAIVVNELGGVEGLVTLEDILEEIVGEIEDEADKEEFLVQTINKNTIVVDAKMTIEDLKAVDSYYKFPKEIPEHKAISLLFLDRLNRFPKKGESIHFSNMMLTVEQMGKWKIEKIRITKKVKSKNQRTKRKAH